MNRAALISCNKKNRRPGMRFSHYQKSCLNFCSYRLFLIIFIMVDCYLLPVQSQTPAINSLKKELHNPQSNKLSTLLALCWRGESMSSDTIIMYAREAKQISVRNGDPRDELLADAFIARSYYLKGGADTALSICNAGLARVTDINSMFFAYREFMRYKISCLTKLRKMKESIDEDFQLLGNAEKQNDISGKILAYNNLGVNNNILENRPEALSWVNKAFLLINSDAVTMNESLPYTNICAMVFINASAMNFYRNNNDSRYFFLRKAYAIARRNQNLKVESDCYDLEGLVYSEQNKTDSAEQMLKKAVAMQEQIGNIQYILVGISGLETFYANEKNYPKAIQYIRLAQSYSRKYHEPIVFAFYRDLAQCYKLMKNYQAYGETMDTLIMIKDSLYQKGKAEDLAKLEAQYDVTSKEAFIARQNLELLHKDIWIAIAVLVILVVAGSSFLLFRRSKSRQLTALTEAEEKERKRIAADLHDNIGAYASAISAGIDEIESKKLIPDATSIRNLKNNATEIINSLRDTIWAFNKESVTFTGISDRIKIYTQKIQPSYPQINIGVEEHIKKEKKLSPVQALHVFRIVQEAVHNALRHSGGHQVVITVMGTDELAGISVEDDGTGFDPQTVHLVGNGLTNVKTRACEAGFAIAFEQVLPHGTGISIRAKIK
jgi:signal transduction histidine kinase